MLYIKKSKYVILILTLFLFFLLFCFCFNKVDLEFSNQVYKEDLVLNVLINNQLCSYDKENDVYYYYTDYNNYKKWNFEFNSLYELDYDIRKIDDNSFLIKVYSDDFYQNINLIATSLPIIDFKDLSSVFEKISLTYPDVDYNFNFDLNDNNLSLIESVPYNARFDGAEKNHSLYENVLLKVRGASSTLYPKKAYKVSFEEKVTVYDLPKDDKYVLDALYIDRSKIRNLLSSSLWNEINNNQYIDNDLRGKFVEVFIDDEYVGIYVLKEKIDKSVTNISDDGVILKSIFHMNDYYINEFLSYDYSISDDSFLNFDIKYFNKLSFYSIINKMKEYYTQMDFNSIDDNFYLDNYLNYYIFVTLISGNDNVDYNYYLSVSDNSSKILITPWDMDLTWGLSWSDDSLFSKFSMESSSDVSWMDNNITKNMDDKTLSLLKDRYWELRKNVITMDTINGYLDSYEDLLVNSGAAKRDSERWYEYDIKFEIEQIREWAKLRIDFLDQYFS